MGPRRMVLDKRRMAHFLRWREASLRGTGSIGTDSNESEQINRRHQVARSVCQLICCRRNVYFGVIGNPVFGWNIPRTVLIFAESSLWYKCSICIIFFSMIIHQWFLLHVWNPAFDAFSSQPSNALWQLRAYLAHRGIRFVNNNGIGHRWEI